MKLSGSDVSATNNLLANKLEIMYMLYCTWTKGRCWENTFQILIRAIANCWLGEDNLGAKGNGKNFFRLECVVKWDDAVLLGMQPLGGT